MTSLYMLDTGTCAFILRRSRRLCWSGFGRSPGTVGHVDRLPPVNPLELCIISVGAIYPKLCLLRMVE